MRLDPAPLKKTLVALWCLFFFQVLTDYFGKPFWVNLTESEPLGLYRKLTREIRRGACYG
jgi:hypothetical protein